jgi:DNA-binding CsgD family transcriptional regulator
LSAPTAPAVDPAFARQARERWDLTPRETDVAWLTAQGVTRRKEVARQLGITTHSVKNYRTSIRQKMAIEPWADYAGTLLAIQAHSVYERTARAVALGALADDFAALERLTRGVLTYLDREGT